MFRRIGKCLAVIAIPLFATVTTVLSFKAIIEILILLGIISGVSGIGIPLTITLWAVAAFITVATVIPMISPLWRKLSVWGQHIDNYIQKKFFGKEYYIDRAERLIKKSKNLVMSAQNDLSRTHTAGLFFNNIQYESLSESALEKIKQIIKQFISFFTNTRCEVEPISLPIENVNGHRQEFIPPLYKLNVAEQHAETALDLLREEAGDPINEERRHHINNDIFTIKRGINELRINFREEVDYFENKYRVACVVQENRQVKQQGKKEEINPKEDKYNEETFTVPYQTYASDQLGDRDLVFSPLIQRRNSACPSFSCSRWHFWNRCPTWRRSHGNHDEVAMLLNLREVPSA